MTHPRTRSRSRRLAAVAAALCATGVAAVTLALTSSAADDGYAPADRNQQAPVQLSQQQQQELDVLKDSAP